MHWIAAGIISAVFTHRYWPSLPDGYVTLLVLIVISIYLPGKLSKFVIGLLLGTLIAAYSANFHLEKIRVSAEERKHTNIVVKVGSLFTAENLPTNKIFIVEQLNGEQLSRRQRFTARLFVDGPYPFKQGQTWQLRVKLREPYGMLNEAGFDAETYFLSNHIHAKGSVLSARLVNSQTSLRQQIYDVVSPILDGKTYNALLTALAFGDRSLLSDREWTVLRDSGIAHLMAISGLHIGLAYWFGALLGRVFQGMSGERARFLWLPLWTGALLAIAYAWLSGFSIPTIRALTVVICLCFLTRLRVNLSPMSLLLFALAACLIVDPLAIFSISFWMSFSAVFVLSLFAYSPAIAGSTVNKNGKFRFGAKVKQLLAIQLVITVGMLPVINQIFDGISPFSLFINLLAVPWVSVLTVPLVLIALLCSPISLVSKLLWTLADMSLFPIWRLAESVEGTWLSLPTVSNSWLIILCSFLFIFVLFRSRQMLIPMVTVALILVGWKIEEPSDNYWRASVLDVGHGLAVLIEKNQHAILYDTGARWPNGSIAESIISPVLRQRGIDNIDGLILSHADGDHAGGREWVEDNLKPNWQRSSSVQKGHQPCVAGEKWQWEGLTFIVLWPDALATRAGNEDSCVVWVSDGTSGFLLTGDVTRRGERHIAARYSDFRTDVILVPHHGSKTSSSEVFLSTFLPDIGVVSSARYSAWKLPAAFIAARYRSTGVRWIDTAEVGQVDLLFSGAGVEVQTRREDVQPYWYRIGLAPKASERFLHLQK
ncbi:DNA internalization-related competence protein ComEC/Rec2 [Veronia nyctiphanis]|uniref:DNA internalization-related competence protein ComEC/Rec2 n=1 Tax=Veronia nyctiphanis TaxID=1278244 RepID=A0A4Q0YNI9_9GAMM|nr:DNA internalization-related competence protein ComEC/Rec2 [Veronia nyctiphanis]RXJ72426.1 DNA internalization-related competence protein ComEC/Rec2 [Veronia nyctiphanis]